MKMPKKTSVIGAENSIRLFAAVCVILLTLFSLYSGGELLGLLTVVLLLALAYKIIRYALVETYFEKLFFLTIGMYFTTVSIFGFTLIFFGLNLSVENFLILAILDLIAISYVTRGKKPCKVNIDQKRLLLIGGAFIIAFFVYMWPALPSFTSPCTFGFDCTLHMEYMGTIYSLGAAVPPVLQWRYYPNGFHINGALLAHALEPDMPFYSNFIYPFTAFIAAMTVAILAGILYDRLKNKTYVLLFLIAILTVVYPASALTGFGYWASILGIYYPILFIWLLSDFVNAPKDKRIMAILLAFAIGSHLAYQILTSILVILSFVIAATSLIKQPLSSKLKLTVTFLLIFGIFYTLHTAEAYSRYLSYSDEPVSTYDYFSNRTPQNIGLNKGGIDIRINGTRFQIKTFQVHVEEVFVSPGVNLMKLISKGLKPENLKSFYLEGTSGNLSSQSGSTLFYDIKWFGLLTLLLMAVGLLYSYGKRDCTLVFMEASIINIYLFALGLNAGRVNDYYYSKAMYAFIYPVALYAIIGIEELISRMDSIKKKTILVVVVMLLMTAYSMKLMNKDSVGILIGERGDIYENGQYWPLLEFNRFMRYYNMAWGIKKDSYGFGGWLKMMNITLPWLSDATNESSESYTTSGVWKAASDFSQHELGHEGPDGSWEAEKGRFGYLIGRNYINIPPGSYTVSFTLKTDDNSKGDEPAGYIEVSKDYGTEVVVGNLVRSKDFINNNTCQDFNLTFDATEPLHNAQFRIHYDKYQILLNVEKVTMTQN